MNVRTRFAPSPTGFLHVGNLRSALFAYLFAKKNNGTFLLRIEDTDRERFIEGGVENILNSLKWANIEPDEGVFLTDDGKVAQKGKNGPYIQSERLVIYQKYVEQLLNQGDAYYCFCSKEKLEQTRKYQELNKLPTGYDGHCRQLNFEESKKRVEAGENHVVRMKMPKTGVTKFKDLVRGDVEFKNELVDDQVILKADGFPTYHLAVVVDDHEMEITHVIRGEDWLSSVPKHIQLYKMFNWTLPEFAHLSLLVNEKKQKLSKRHGDVSVRDYIEKGYLPEALVNFIAFLGWNPGDERELFSLEELGKEFDFEKVSKAAAVFNLEKLNWYNREYIKSMDPVKLAKRCQPFFANKGVKSEKYKVESIVELEQGRASTLVELVENVGFIFADKLEYDAELLIWKKSTREDAKEKLNLLATFLQNIPNEQWARENLEGTTMLWIESQGFANGDVLWPMRVALSGLKNSPGPFEIAAVLDKEKTLYRIGGAIKKL